LRITGSAYPMAGPRLDDGVEQCFVREKRGVLVGYDLAEPEQDHAMRKLEMKAKA
jgi:hypothetical protein